MRAFLAAAAIAMAILAPASAKKPEEPEPPPSPEVRLTVSPHHGFRPLTITLTGTILGVSGTDPDYCHAGIEWEARNLLGLTTSSVENPRCLHPPEQVAVQLAHHKTVTLYDPGLYYYRFIVYRRDGARLLSATQEVRVIDVGP